MLQAQTEIQAPQGARIAKQQEGDATTTIVEVEGPRGYDYWSTVIIQGISSGSWAILLALVVLWTVVRKPFMEYLGAHIGLMRTLTQALDRIKDFNSEELQHLQKQEDQLADIQDRVKTIEREVIRKED